MPLFTSNNSVTVAARIPLELDRRLRSFREQAGISQSAAIRLLLEQSLDSGIDPSELSMVAWNARAEAVNELDEVITTAVEKFFGR
jgi:predicted DNA-binding protein